LIKKAFRNESKIIPVWALIAIVATVSIVAASAIFGSIEIGYRITPSGANAPTMTPSTLNLDLGAVPSGSSGTKDFGKVATLSLPVGYDVTFTLDLASQGDFPNNTYVKIIFYNAGETNVYDWVYLNNFAPHNTSSKILEAGSYDVAVILTYSVKSVTVETPGSIKIYVSFPG